MDSIFGLGGSPWRREWLPTSVFLTEQFHGQRSLVAYGLQPMGSQSTGHNWVTNTVKLQNNCKETKGIFLVLKISTLMWMSVHICEVQFSSVAQSCPTLCDPMDCSTPGFPVHHQLLEFTHAHVHWVSDAIQPSHPLLLSPSVFPSIRVFSNESALCIRWPKY